MLLLVERIWFDVVSSTAEVEPRPFVVQFQDVLPDYATFFFSFSFFYYVPMIDARPLDVGKLLPLVRKPGQYVGGELHAVTSVPDDAHLNVCLLFPDLYEIGMSHQGLQILYHILNNDTRFIAHRSYVPDVDMEQEMRAAGLPLFSLEAKVPVSSYDVLGITLPYELCYTNILTALNLADMPLRAADRDQSHPLVLGGGACALNPEPVADFFDAIVLGDGEEIILELAELLLKAKKQVLERGEVLTQLAGITGVYVPAFFAPRYDGGRLLAVEPLVPEMPTVRKRVLAQLSAAPYLHHPLVPVVNPVHDRLGVEIARGCTRGCRFCQAGITYRPVRERTLEEIMELANQGIASSGFEELALLSLSTGDFSCLGELMGSLMDRFADDFVSVSMPSMRVGTLTPEIMEQIKRVRKTGFTIAPEAGTDRLREVINKGITEEDLLATCFDAFSLGWKLIKLYFMIGLPTETEEDIEGIIALAKKARAQVRQGKGRPVQINLGVSTFIPKPHTPFQWEPQIGLQASGTGSIVSSSCSRAKGIKSNGTIRSNLFLKGSSPAAIDASPTFWNEPGKTVPVWTAGRSGSTWNDGVRQPRPAGLILNPTCNGVRYTMSCPGIICKVGWIALSLKRNRPRRLPVLTPRIVVCMGARGADSVISKPFGRWCMSGFSRRSSRSH